MSMSQALIVDDNRQNLYLLQTLLENQGYEVLMAGNGLEALELARRDPPKIVISDILMPVLDGFALCREWMKDERLRAIPFVFYTATYTGPRDEGLAMSLGAACFIVKPLEAEAFSEIILQVLREHEAGRMARPTAPATAEEPDYYRLYNEALIRKLEKKTLDLGETRRVLEQEITEHKRSEEALRETNDYLENLLNYANAPIIVWDPQFRITRFNHACESLTGRAAEEVIGKSVEILFPPELAAGSMELIAKTLRGERWETVEIDVLQSGGFIRTVRWNSATLFGANGETPVAAIAQGQDITERKHAEESRDRAEAEMRQAQKMEAVGRLAGGVAHDFNNMLGVIIGHAEFGLMRLDPLDPVCRDFQEIQKAAQRSADLTRQLLAFSRKQIVLPRVIDLNAAIDCQRQMLGRLVGEEIELRFVPAADLWKIRIDPSQVDQILANLAVNARDAIAGVGMITIETANIALDETSCRIMNMNPGEYVMIAFSDTGCGMDAATLERIFEPFFTTKEEGKGTGLGLSTVYGIVRQHLGGIPVYSHPGLGTTFKIYFPRCLDEAEKTGEEQLAPAPAGTETVFLVEDEEQILALAREILERYGFTVLEARTPGEACLLAEKHPGVIHLLLTDVVMPGMNGRELYERIVRIKPGIRVLFMSGYTADIIAHRGVVDEGIEFIQKPFSVSALAAKVRAVLDA